MVGQIHLSKAQRDEILVLLEVGKDLLTKMFDSSAEWSHALTPDELTSGLIKIINEPLKAKSIAATLVQFQLLCAHSELSLRDISEGLSENLIKAGWAPIQLDTWNELLPIVINLIELPVIRRVAKAVRLSYEHPCLLQSGKIITDIRPIFNSDYTAIEASVVSHSLSIKYDGADGEKSLSLSMDERDVKSLLSQCEKALIKADTAAKTMSKIAQIPTVISGNISQYQSKGGQHDT